MINNLPAFETSLIPAYPTVAGLRIFVGPPTGPIAGYVTLGTTTVAIASGFVNVTPISTTYIYLDLTIGQILSNTTGFPSGVYTIAIVTTNGTEVTGILDSRPDVTAIGSGGGGSVNDAVLNYSSPATISINSGQSVFVTCTSGANPLALPTVASWMAGLSIKITKTDGTGFIGITGGINGTYYLSNQYQFWFVECDGTNWYTVGGN